MASGTILVVEDDESVGRMVQRCLESAGYHVTLVTCGMEALHQTEASQPDAVVLDLGLPDVSGLDVASHLRRMAGCEQLPIVMLTGRSHPADRLRGFAYGADAYLIKPFQPSDLLQSIDSLFA